MKKSKINQDSADTSAFKDAARRLQENLKLRGISLNHAHALEALTVSLGVANWRTLLTKLNGSSAPVWDETCPRWQVNAIYTDNNQRFSDSYFGETPLEAQIVAQFDRHLDLCTIEVSSVIDNLTGKIADSETFAHESNLLPQSTAILKLCELALKNLPLNWQGNGVGDADDYDAKTRAIEFWKAICEDKENELLCEALDELALNDQTPKDYPEDATQFEDSRGCLEPIDVHASLTTLLSLASGGLNLAETENSQESGVFQALQTKHFLLMFKERVEVFLNGEEV